jgi:hypothetical protein
LAGVGGDAVKLQQHDERAEARIPVAIHGDALGSSRKRRAASPEAGVPLESLGIEARIPRAQ